MSCLCESDKFSWNLKLLFVILINFFIAGIMYYFSVLSSSSALFAEFAHNFCDGMCILMAFVAAGIRTKTIRTKTGRSTYNLSRVEIVSALLNSSVLIVVAFFALFNSLKSIQSIVIGSIMVKAAIIAFLMNGLCVLIIGKSASLNEEAVKLHLKIDCLFSGLTAFAGLIIWKTGMYFIDGIVGAIISIHMIKHGINVFKKSVGILVQLPPEDVCIEKIVKVIENFPDVVDVHHIHLWQFDEKNMHFECHITVNGKLSVREADNLRRNVEEELKKLGILHSTIQIESSCNNRVCLLGGYC